MTQAQDRIANTPAPPYYAVTTTALLADNLEGYFKLAETLHEEAKRIQGFLGLEYCLDAQCGIAVSYWRDKDAIEQWRNSSGHLKAKQIAKQRWFKSYITRIAYVDAAY